MGFLLEGFSEAVDLILGGDAATFHAIFVSLVCTITSVTLAALVGIPCGAWLGLYRRKSRIRVLALRFGMTIPTVIIGLLVFVLLSRQGLLGSLGLLYTKSAIIAGEFLLAFPLLATLTYGLTRNLDITVVETSLTLGSTRAQAMHKALGECRAGLTGALVAAFGRCFTELGIAITVGGNILTETRTLPAAIQLELSRGDLARAMAPGIILLLIAGALTVLSSRLSGENRT